MGSAGAAAQQFGSTQRAHSVGRPDGMLHAVTQAVLGGRAGICECCGCLMMRHTRLQQPRHALTWPSSISSQNADPSATASMCADLLSSVLASIPLLAYELP